MRFKPEKPLFGFVEHNARPRYGVVDGDCMARALATVTGMEYSAARKLCLYSNSQIVPQPFRPEYKEMKACVQFARKGSLESGTATTKVFRDLMAGLDFEDMGISPHDRVDVSWLRGVPAGRYVVNFREHSTAFIDGKFWDTFDPQTDPDVTYGLYECWRYHGEVA